MQRSYPEISFKLQDTTACDLLKPKFKEKISPLREPGGGLPKIGGIKYFFLDQKGRSKDFFKLKREITYI